MGKFIRESLPEPQTYFEEVAGLALVGAPRSNWKTTRCEFHDGSDSMRIHIERGAFICMACGAKGGDIVAYHMAAHGMGFVEAAKALGAYEDDGAPHNVSVRPTPIAARTLLESVAHEVTVASIVATDMANGKAIGRDDAERIVTAAGRIRYVAEAANAK